MRKIIIPERKEKLISQANDIINRKDGDHIKRILAVQAALRDVPTNEIAKCFDVTERSIQLWFNKVKNNGFDSLTRKKGSGRPRKLTRIQIQEIDEWIIWGGPPSYLFPDAKLWTSEMLSQAIMYEFGVEISKRWCSNQIKKSRGELTDKHLSVRYNRYREYEKDVHRLRDENKKLKKEIKELKEKLASAQNHPFSVNESNVSQSRNQNPDCGYVDDDDY